VYRPAEIEQALALVNSGLNYSQVSRLTGVSRPTIRRWAIDGRPLRGLRRRAGTCLHCTGYRFPVPRATESSYSYLLGLYLGDGCIASHPRGVFRLSISLDRAYPRIVHEAVAAISIVMPASKVGLIRSNRDHLDQPTAYSRHWPCLFPQHGPGLKHDRPIKLTDWQRAMVDQFPWRFLRGAHSLGRVSPSQQDQAPWENLRLSPL